MSRLFRRSVLPCCVLLLVSWLLGPAPAAQAQVPGDYVLLVVNNLGMHCMNKDHHNMSILPPFNTLNAQIIKKGDATSLPQIITGFGGATLNYSIPGNTVSVGKTDFWSTMCNCSAWICRTMSV